MCPVMGNRLSWYVFQIFHCFVFPPQVILKFYLSFSFNITVPQNWIKKYSLFFHALSYNSLLVMITFMCKLFFVCKKMMITNTTDESQTSTDDYRRVTDDHRPVTNESQTVTNESRTSHRRIQTSHRRVTNDYIPVTYESQTNTTNLWEHFFEYIYKNYFQKGYDF